MVQLTGLTTHNAVRSPHSQGAGVLAALGLDPCPIGQHYPPRINTLARLSKNPQRSEITHQVVKLSSCTLIVRCYQPVQPSPLGLHEPTEQILTSYHALASLLSTTHQHIPLATTQDPTLQLGRLKLHLVKQVIDYGWS